MLQDLRYAARWLRRSPGFAFVAVMSLGLGIGVNTAMFSLVDAVLLRPIPVSDPSSLVDVFTSSSDGDEYATTSYPDFLDLKAQNAVFADMTAYTPMFAPLGLGDRARLVLGQIVTSNHFQMASDRFWGARGSHKTTNLVRHVSRSSPIACGKAISAAMSRSLAARCSFADSITRSSASRQRSTQAWFR
jgi:hypothetical protein